MSRYIIRRYSRENWRVSESECVIYRRFESWLTAAVSVMTSEYIVKNHRTKACYTGVGRNTVHAKWLADDVMHSEARKARELRINS